MLDGDTVFWERDGIVAVEAEHFYKQTRTDRRAFYITTPTQTSAVTPDPDDAHVAGASGGAYVEILPDTRVTHDDPLTTGENFSPQPATMATLHYRVHFDNPGRYYIWCRVFSTGTEDNGVHVGLNGTWPESGRRWQTTHKHAWAWDSRQRTEQNHQGERFRSFLDTPSAGEHEIMFSMREDGFEFDKWILARDRDYIPEGVGPAPVAKRGVVPAAFAVASLASAANAPRAPVLAASSDTAARAPVPPRGPDGDGSVAISGELKQWHKVTLSLAGPFAHERDTAPNPFTDYALNVAFEHESGAPSYIVPGCFAADGRAAESGAEAGNVWRAHLSPDKPGRWTHRIMFSHGPHAAVEGSGRALAPYHGRTGTFEIAPSDKTGRDFRAHGRLQYQNGHYLRFAGSGAYFLKAGADAPETLLAYADFDGTERGPKTTAASRRGRADPGAQDVGSAPARLEAGRPRVGRRQGARLDRRAQLSRVERAERGFVSHL